MVKGKVIQQCIVLDDVGQGYMNVATMTGTQRATLIHCTGSGGVIVVRVMIHSHDHFNVFNRTGHRLCVCACNQCQAHDVNGQNEWKPFHR